MNDIFTGKLVRLSAYDPEEVGKAFSNWSRDSEYWRLMDAGAARAFSVKQVVKFFEKDIDEASPAIYFFGVRTLADDKLIGEMILDVVNWSGRDAFVGLGIGERENWGKGYGTDMMNVLLRFAFTEVNLCRVTLIVFDYNPRAIRSYASAGPTRESEARNASVVPACWRRRGTSCIAGLLRVSLAWSIWARKVLISSTDLKIEVAWATAWAPHESQQKPLKPGSAKFRLADALKVPETKLN